MAWEVRIIETASGEVEKTIPCRTERAAERVEGGVLINLNHDKYHTEIVERAQEAKKGSAA